jgi:hypothetical protein
MYQPVHDFLILGLLGFKLKEGYRRNPLNVKVKERGAPKGAILELSFRNLCQPCHRLGSLRD